MKELWERSSSRYNKIRARATLPRCDTSERQQVELEFLDIVSGRGPLSSGAPQWEPGHKIMAAYFLAAGGTRPRQCVVETLSPHWKVN